MLRPAGSEPLRTRPKRPKPVTERVGPFKGMRSTMMGSADPEFAEWIHNGYILDPYNGGPVTGRPGRRPYPTAVVNTLVGVGSDPKAVQLLAVWTDPSGQGQVAVAIVDGHFYTTKTPVGASSAPGWNESVSVGQLATAGITLSATKGYYACQFNGKLVICDNAQAFTWDGTADPGSATGGITHLTNAGSDFYGRPTVYADKLFFIRSSQRAIVWSEEGDETTGYEAGGFANAWDLRQTSQEPITSLIGMNESLDFIRRGSIGSVYGGEASAFQSTTTIDAVSGTVGSDCPEGVCLAGDTVFFIDHDGRPACYIKGSSNIIPLYQEIERAFTPYLQDGLIYERLAAPNNEMASLTLFGSNNQVIYFRTLDVVAYTYRYFFSSQPAAHMDILVLFHARTKRCQGVWSFPTGIAKIAEMYDVGYGTGQYALVLIDSFGYCYTVNPAMLNSSNFPTSAFTDEDLANGAAQDVQVSVIGPRHFQSAGTELATKQLDIDYLGWQNSGFMQVRFVTPGVMAAGGVRFDPSQPVSVPLDGLVGPNDLTTQHPPVMAHATVGLNEVGRFIAFGFSWPHQATRARLVGWQVTAVPVGKSPDAF